MTSTRSPRTDFRDAASALLALVALVPADGWARPGLGEWSVQELVGHAGRAFNTLEDYLAAPPAEPTVPDAGTYLRAGAAAGLNNSAAVADRGRAAGRDLGPQPAQAITELADRVLHLVDTAPDDAGVASRLGAMRLIDYLPTRTFELAVHSLDLQAALAPGTPWSLPRGPLEAALRLATELAVDQGLGPRLLLGLTGRRPLPEGTCVL
jgi:uncharacterized protein (TIGR03083 family)